jgi:hypothetical protein
MGRLITFPTKPVEGAQAPSITRTPELAFVLAILSVLPPEARRKALLQVQAQCGPMTECQASMQAAQIAATLLRKA